MDDGYITVLATVAHGNFDASIDVNNLITCYPTHVSSLFLRWLAHFGFLLSIIVNGCSTLFTWWRGIQSAVFIIFLFFWPGAAICIAIGSFPVCVLLLQFSLVFGRFFSTSAESITEMGIITAYNLLELWTKTFLSMRRWKHDFKLLNWLSYLVFITCIISQC